MDLAQYTFRLVPLHRWHRAPDERPDTPTELVAQCVPVLYVDKAAPECAITTVCAVKSGCTLTPAEKRIWYASPTPPPPRPTYIPNF